MSTYIPCPQCNEEITPDSDFCPHCGVVFTEAGDIRCETHPDRKGAAVCIICRIILCEECGTVAEGRALCHAHENVNIQQDWAEVYSSSELSDAEVRKAVLESSGFKVQAQNFHSVGFVWDGGGDNPISRSNIGRPAILLVPIPEYLAASETLAAWENAEPEGMENRD